MNSNLENYIKINASKSFKDTLFEMIDRKQMSEVEVYKKAMITRNVFHTIRIQKRPSKNTIIRLAIALESNKEDLIKLLNSAGYSINYNDKFDLIVLYHIEKGGL